MNWDRARRIELVILWAAAIVCAVCLWWRAL